MPSGDHAAHAHAFGERYDLPVPLWMNLAGGGAVVVLSFVMAAWFLKPEAQTPRVASRSSRRTGLRPLGSEPVLLAIRIVSVFLFVIGLLAGFIGLPDYSRNAAPTIFWVLGWVGLAFISVLLGNVWLLLNPWLILFGWADALWRRLTRRGLVARASLPARIGVLPGILTVIGFTWFMLASGLAGDLPFARLRRQRLFGRHLGRHVFIRRARSGSPMARPSRCSSACLRRFLAHRAAGRRSARSAPAPAVRRTITATASIARRPSCRRRADKREITLRGYGIGLIVRRPLSLSMIVLVLMVLALVAFEGFMDTAQWIDADGALGELQGSDGIHAPMKTTLVFLAATALLFGSVLRRRPG